MSNFTKMEREYPGTYFVQNRSNQQEEIARLELQDRMLTSGMGGVLPELPDPTSLQRVLDVGCGTGGWLMEAARTYPQIEQLVGIDVNTKVVTYASDQAAAQQLDQHVQFQTMDATQRLEFPAASFDLINQRFGTSWLRTWEWQKVLSEYQRLTRPGGIIRITEPIAGITSNSPALTKLSNIFVETFYRSGRTFAPSSNALIDELARLLTEQGIQAIQTQTHFLVYRAGTIEGELFYRDIELLFRVSLPFFQKWTIVPDNYREIYRQALKEMQQPDFVATWNLLTAWGIKREGRKFVPKKEPQREYPSTYIVQGRSNWEEIAHLELQDKMLTTMMGGVLPELPDPTSLQRILDVGCGAGAWLMETARAYPQIEQLVGIDVNTKVVNYASDQAAAQQLDQRVQFQTMDAAQRLEFPVASFDLINQRFGTSWLRTWEWQKLLLEYQRLTRRDGIIRITESTLKAESDSPALTNLWNICLEALYHSGRLFTANSDGITGQLVHLMTEHGIQNIQTCVHNPVYRAGTVEGQYFYEDMLYLFRLFLPFIQKWTNVPSDYQQIYQQALKEMQQPDFAATGTLLTVWGTSQGSR